MKENKDKVIYWILILVLSASLVWSVSRTDEYVNSVYYWFHENQNSITYSENSTNFMLDLVKAISCGFYPEQNSISIEDKKGQVKASIRRIKCDGESNLIIKPFNMLKIECDEDSKSCAKIFNLDNTL